MEEVVTNAILEQAEVGDHYIIPTSRNTEIQLIKETKESLENFEVAQTDGSAKVSMKGKFDDCNEPVDVKVCLYTMLRESFRGK